MHKYEMYNSHEILFYPLAREEANDILSEEQSDVIIFQYLVNKYQIINGYDKTLPAEMVEMDRVEFLEKYRNSQDFEFGYVRTDLYTKEKLISNIINNKKIKKIKIYPLIIGSIRYNPSFSKQEIISRNGLFKEIVEPKIKNNGVVNSAKIGFNIGKILTLNKLFGNKYKGSILISDGLTHAQDNGEILAKYLEKNGYKNYYYAVDKNCSDFERLKKEINVVEAGSIKHMLVSINYAQAFIAYYPLSYYSYFTDNNYKFVSKFIKGRRVFIEHGITYNDHSKYGVHKKNKAVNLTDYICGAKVEYDVLSKVGNFDFHYTGLPRHDFLLENSRKDDKIMIFFTWRRFLNTNKENIADLHNHFNTINDLLMSKELHDLYLAGNEINIFLHKAYFSNQKLLKVPAYVNAYNFENANIQEEIATSKMLITDYSSVMFEFTVQNKPIINYQFDKKRFFESHYHPLIDIDGMGISNVAVNLSEVNKKIIEIKDLSFEVTAEQRKINDSFFGETDTNNCKRVIDFFVENK